MKFTSAAILAVLPLAMAMPTWDHKDDHKVDEHKDKDWSSGKGDEGYNTAKDAFPFHFTSTLVTYASPNTIINNSQVAVPGLPEGWGKFQFGLNSVDNVICYNITAWLRGNYSSPAVTATHIHQAAVGAAGPPRIAFPNPRPKANENQDLDAYSWRESLGCLTGPFTTGVLNNGTDTGTGFTVAALEANPTGFFADTHTVQFPAGAIRGQLEEY